MIFTAWSDGRFEMPGRTVRCALGRSGVVRAQDKGEGDGATPLGLWPMRRVLYRPDQDAPATTLPLAPIGPDDGWCDDAADPLYNRPVRLPYPASCERMWREDRLYDIVVVLGYNDEPPIAGRGSCIFLHLARPGYSATEGCIALARPHLETMLAVAEPRSAVRVARS